MKNKYLFKDANFVKCLKNGGAKDNKGNKVKLSFTDNGDGTWTLNSDVFNITDINCSDKYIGNIE